MDPVGLLDLPVEVLTVIQSFARNFSTQRLVCSRLNQVGSKLLLDRTIKALRTEIDVCIKSISHRVEGGDRMEATRLQQMLDDVETLNRLLAELDGVERTMHEKSESLSALSSQDSATMSERHRATLLKLCDLHPEFLSVSAVRSRLAEVASRSGISSQKRPAEEPWRIDPLRVGPVRGDPVRPVPNPFPINPYGDPRYPDFGAEPDPDHMRPPPFGEDDDRDIQPFPIYPGQPFPGMPYPGGGGGRRDGEPQPPMPGFNPDFERDRNPLGMPPRGGRRGMPPPGPFNPGAGRPGGGGFGGPRFL